MKIVIVSGSHRENSQSSKVSQWLSLALKNNKYDTNVIDISESILPIWDESAWNSDSALSKQAKPYQDLVMEADALILVAPEWHGMVPSGLKNFLLFLSPKQAAHKPVLLVGVSAGRGGSYPIAELRMSGYKNNRMVYIPDHLIVQDVVNVMNSENAEDGTEADRYIKKRALYSLDVLMAYAKALKPMREAGGLLNKDFPNGM